MKKTTISKRTKQELQEALFEALKQRPLDKISVKSLTDACEIPRSTFYYYFDDLYDFTSWSCANYLMRKVSIGAAHGGWHSILLNLFRVGQESPTVCKSVASSNQVWAMADSFCDRCCDELTPVVAQIYPEFEESDNGTLRRVTALYGHIIVSEMMKWIRRNMPQSPEQMALFLEQAITINFENSVRRLRTNECSMALAGAYDQNGWT